MSTADIATALLCLIDERSRNPYEVGQNSRGTIQPERLLFPVYFCLWRSFATLSIGNGATVKAVQELLGHSSQVITLSTYEHAMEGAGRDAINRLAQSTGLAG